MAKPSRKRKDRIDPVAPRNAFRVAAVKEQIREALPDLLFTPRKAAKTGAKRPAITLDNPPDYRDRGEALTASPARKSPPPPSRDLGVSNPDAVKRDETLRGCKAKPKSIKGNGTGRPFVPWCKK